MVDKDVVKFFSLCDKAVWASKFKGSFMGCDIAMKIMDDSEGKTLEEHVEFIDKYILREYKEKKEAEQSPELNEKQECDARTNLKFKLKADEAFGRKHQDDKNRWERERRKNNKEWRDYRNHLQMMRKRKMARAKVRAKMLAKKVLKRLTRVMKLEAKKVLEIVKKP